MTYFTDDELKCRGSGVIQYNTGFINALNELREAYGKPMIINSGCRSLKYNESIKGAPRSYHLYEGVADGRTGALAVDVKIKNAHEAFDLIEAAIARGWSFGVYSKFIHLDRRVDLGHGRTAFWGSY